MSWLEARRVGKCFRPGSGPEVWAVRDVSLQVAQGSFSLFTGPSGSGKTTLLALLGALDRPSEGQVVFDGRDLGACSDTELGRLRRRVGFVFQGFALIPRLSVWENVTYPLIPRGISRAERFATAESLLGRLGMAPKITRAPEELSAGEQQRVSAARALAVGPELLIADEPTSSLDRGTASTLVDCLREFHATGKTVLVSSHDLELASLATCVYELDGGRLKSRDGEGHTP